MFFSFFVDSSLTNPLHFIISSLLLYPFEFLLSPFFIGDDIALLFLF
jgi:hypothetical protein